jgi:bacterioferritin
MALIDTGSHVWEFRLPSGNEKRSRLESTLSLLCKKSYSPLDDVPIHATIRFIGSGETLGPRLPRRSQQSIADRGTIMDKPKLIEKLNECLRHEWTGVAQYAQAGFVVAGLWREVYSEMFFDSAKESFGHAKLVGEKIVALGGIPTVERNSVKQSHDLLEMLNYAFEFESKAVKCYNEALALAAGDRALEVFLENILEEEQDGVDTLTRILRDPKAVAASTGAAKVG